ncbi:GvpL/GvpF family gas vesicle protein [Nocardia yunnanensis]|nr:GvpL/GvpF family gas vesicle protein [Nocardia yunnanensis]
MDNEYAQWVYAVRRGEVPPPAATGVCGETVRCIHAAGLTAVVGAVPLADFDSDALQRNLNDFDWLAAAARAHHAVVEAASAGRPVIPVRLAVLCRDDEGVRRLLIERESDFRSALDLVDGRAEWGVRAYVRPAEPDPEPARPTSGADYLRERRDSLRRHRSEREAAELAASGMYRVLCRHAVAARCRPTTETVHTGRRGPLVLNATYLVDNTEATGFLSTAEQFDENELLTIERSGPWPPYTFVGAAGDL